MREMKRPLNCEFKTYCRSKGQNKMFSQRLCSQLFTAPDCSFPEWKVYCGPRAVSGPAQLHRCKDSFLLPVDLPVCSISPESLKHTHLVNSVLYWDLYRWMSFKFLDLNSQCILFKPRPSCKLPSSESYFPQHQKDTNRSVLFLVSLTEKSITT